MPGRSKEAMASRVRAAVRNVVVVGLLGLLLGRAEVAHAQTCTWSGSGEVVPASTPLRAHRSAFHAPTRIAVDGDGSVYVTDPRKGQVTVLDRYGRLAGLFGGFDGLLGIAVDQSRRIYVGEQGPGRVRVFDSAWNPLYFLGGGDGEFFLPNDIAIDEQYNWVYVVDSDAHMVKVYAAADGAPLFNFGGMGTGPGQFRFPTGIYITPPGVGPAVAVYVADHNNDRIQVLDRNGTFQRCIGGGSVWSPRLGRPQGLTGDAAGRLYAIDAFQGFVRVFDRYGYWLTAIGGFGEGAGQLSTPMDLAIDPYNRLVVTSANNGRVEMYGIDAFTDPHIIQAVVEMRPDTVNLGRGKSTVSAFIELPGYSLNQIDLTTITANGAPSDPASAVIADFDGDGTPDLKVDFDQDLVFAGMADGEAPVVVSGELFTLDLFEGLDTVHLHVK